ncbi:MAG: zinc-binding dehydrogenase [Deltaproteobacteria bacterium]|nr:zinc-binding dehydrogenase [Candidatus Zymogenaceae bacterium]
MKSIYFDVNVPKILLTKSLTGIFPFIYYSPLSPVSFGDIPRRDLPGPRWVRVKSRHTGICGADISMFFVAASPSISLAALPGVPRAFMGHEVVGEIIEMGPGVSSLSVGDRIVLQRYLPCCSMKEIEPPCVHCAAGNYTLCENFSEGSLPENLGAGFTEQFIAHESQLVKVPDALTDDQAVLIEPVAVSLHAALARPPKAQEKVLVIGAGTIGLNVSQAARALEPDAIIYLLERIDFKRELGKKLGADHILTGDPYDAAADVTGAKLYRGPLGNNVIMGGFDLIYDCVGYSKTIHDSLRWLKAGGDYVMIGNQLSPVAFDQTPIWQQELTLRGINAHGMEHIGGRTVSSFDLAMEYITDGSINLDGFITHRFPLSDYRKAFKLVKSKSERVIKAVLDISP